MSDENRRADLREKTQQLLQGSLKHVRAAALAAALVPLAAVAISPVVATARGSGGSGIVPSPCDFVTSGGFVIAPGGRDANFGAHGGCKNDGFWGHVNYVDHNNGYHVDSLDITGYLTPFPGSNIRDICGTARTNSDAVQPVFFRVRLIDNGEPGTADMFGIKLSNGYMVSTRLLNNGMGGGGNIQLHDPNPSTTGPSNPILGTDCNGVTADGL